MRRARWNFDHQVGPWRQTGRYHAPDDTVTIQTVSTIDEAVAEGIRAMQNDGRRAHGIGTFGGDWHAIPPGVHAEACRIDPELTSHDTATREAAIRRWLRGPWRVYKIPTGHGYVRGGLAQ